ncbi:hypothetical protein [Curvibacter phage PCA1]|nr:hypothetical protein [Curvibacter phage PCA1]
MRRLCTFCSCIAKLPAVFCNVKVQLQKQMQPSCVIKFRNLKNSQNSGSFAPARNFLPLGSPCPAIYAKYCKLSAQQLQSMGYAVH